MSVLVHLVAAAIAAAAIMLAAERFAEPGGAELKEKCPAALCLVTIF